MSDQEKAVLETARLLSQWLLQYVEWPVEAVPLTSDGGSGAPGEDANPRLKQGVAPGRIVSAQDPEMRHGHKSASQQFEGVNYRP